MTAQTFTQNPLLSVAEARQRYGYQNNASFMEHVRREGVPFIRLNRRKIVFDPAALVAWETRHKVGGRSL